MSSPAAILENGNPARYIVVRPGGLVAYDTYEEAVSRAKVFSATRHAAVYAVVLIKTFEPTLPVGPPLRFG